MTVSTTQIRASYTGDGSSVNFPIPFPFYLSTDISVLLAGSTIGTGYSVSGGVDTVGHPNPGTLTMAAAPAVGANLQIILAVPLTQLVNLVDGTAFPSATVNQVNDRAVQALLRLQDEISRAIRSPDGDVVPSMLLPAAAARASMYLAFDASGNVLPTAALPGTANTPSSLGPIINPITQAESNAGVVPVNLIYPVGHVLRYGAVLDNATDDTTALTNWLKVGGDLTWPVVATAKVTVALPMVSNTKIRAAVGATIRQYTANANVLTGSSISNVNIQGLTMYAPGTMSSTFNGQGFFFSGCTYIDVMGCTVTNHRGYAGMFYNSNHCKAWVNRALNSPVANGDAWSNVGGDFAIEGASSYCELIGNECFSGNGVALQIQQINSTDVNCYNTVAFNKVANPRMYGVNVYFQGGAVNTFTNHVVVGNTIQNVSGYIYFTSPGTYPFGAGIYCNGGTDHTINSNNINGTNTAALSWQDNLAQAGIGVTLAGKCTVNGNTVANCGQYGITIRDPGAVAPATQKISVLGNNVSGCTNASIQLVERANVDISHNQVYGGASDAIRISNTVTQRYGVSINFNDIDSPAGQGILANFMQASSINGNKVRNAGVSGISVNNCSDIGVNANTVVGSAASYNIYIDATVTNFTCEGNTINGLGVTTYGIWLGAHWVIGRSNSIRNCVNEYGGIYAPLQSAVPTTGTWVQRDIVWNGGPISGNFIGWVCVAPGTPGTWKTFGAIS